VVDDREGFGLIRVGVGSDIHRLEEGRALIVGGVRIPFEWGLSGHSDADVLTHAVIDALLGAASLGDIGRHFPSSDERLRGVSSLLMLEKTRDLLGEKGFEVRNVDATVTAENPPLAGWIPEMVDHIASALNLTKKVVSVKATTAKGVGPIGRGEAIGAIATVLIESTGSEPGEPRVPS
jgi:2-C-methyl-D-erythritol 2,4-cyclodiphosphate synthase